MSRDEPFQQAIPSLFETIEDAARDVIRCLGGSKRVGALLWPHKPVGEAERHLLDCVNPDRPHKLSPDELLTLARWGRDAGCHSLMHYFVNRAGYSMPVPISAADEKAELQRQFLDMAARMQVLFSQIDVGR